MPAEKEESKKPTYGSLTKVQHCPECNSSRLIRDYESAEIVCTDCGIVVVSKIADRGPEWRSFDDEQRLKRTRVGAPLTYTIHDKGLSTDIDWHDRDVYGKSLSPGQKSQLYRMRKWQRRTRVSDAKERNLSVALGEITKIAYNLNLPKNALETASVVYRKAVKKELIRGRTMAGVEGASIYIACRQCGIPRTLTEVSNEVKIPGKNEKGVRKTVAHDFRDLVWELGYNDKIKPLEKSKLVSKYTSDFENQSKAEEIANKILNAAEEIKLTAGRNSEGLTAGACYIASVLAKSGKNQKQVSEIAQVTEVTVRNRYKELVERLMFLMAL